MSDNEEKHYWIGQHIIERKIWAVLSKMRGEAALVSEKELKAWESYNNFWQIEQAPSWCLNAITNDHQLTKLFKSNYEQ